MEICEQLVEEHPNVTSYHDGLAGALNGLGIFYYETKQERDAALAAYERSIEIQTGLLQDDPTNVSSINLLAGTYVNVGNLTLYRFEEPQKAHEWYNKGEELLLGVLERIPEHRTARFFLRNARWGQAVAWGYQEDREASLRCWKEAFEYTPLGRERNHFRQRLARAYMLAGDYQASVKESNALIAGTDGLSAPATLSNKYNVACVIAVASVKAGKDESLPEADRARLKEEYATRAVAVLKQVHADGFFERDGMREFFADDKDWVPLRDREDLQEVIQSLEQETADQSGDAGM